MHPCFCRKDHKGSILFEPPWSHTPRATFRKVGMQPLGSGRLLCRWHLHVWLAMIYHHLGIAERSPALAITSSIYRSSSVVRSIKKTWTIFIVSTFLFVSVQIWVSKFLMPQLGRTSPFWSQTFIELSCCQAEIENRLRSTQGSDDVDHPRRCP